MPESRNPGNHFEGDHPEFDDVPTQPVTPDDLAARNKYGEVARQIAGYTLIERLGSGGMGEVWVAEQSQPVKRRVALKLIKEGFGSREVIARFEAERQALALMNHPNIARILDAGATDDGQPYFVMELVEGQPLTTFCDGNRLSIDERLRLFMDVCSGVQHAHQKGIIHRDLKPGNIIVGIEDGVPVPKVIDFGLAKAIDSTQRLTDQSLFTGIGQVLGTLKYMSPEQAGLDNLDIDTRTDIYALGVILYELLTGSTPLDDSSIKGLVALKILEFIRDREPVRPSSRLSSSTNEQVSSITGQRKTDSVRLKRILQGDLDWIVMKALEKDRTRRYESASGFAADIHRYLNSEPVIARPPSLNYRVRKFVRKNRVGVIAASLVTLALVGGIIGTTLTMFRALKAESLAENRLTEATQAREEQSKQRQMAEDRRREAEREKNLAEARRIEAEQNLTYAKKGNEILGSVFSGLDPKAEYATVAELRNALRDNLGRAVIELEGSAIGDSLAVASMNITLGTSLLALGLADQSVLVFQRALDTRVEQLGPNHPDTLIGMNNLALALQVAGQIDRAIPLFEQTLRLREDILGPIHPATLVTLTNLADSYRNAGRFMNAVELAEKSFEMMQETLGCDHPDTLTSMGSLATSYFSAGMFDKGVPLLEEILEIKKKKHGLAHPDTMTCMNNLAAGYYSFGQLDKAVPLYEQALELRMQYLGFDHPDTLTSMNNLAGGYLNSERFEEAVALYERSLKLRENKLGSKHPETLTSMNNLALSYLRAGQLDKSLSLFEETLELTKIINGPEHPNTLSSMGNLAGAYRAVGQIDKAIPLYEQTLEIRKRIIGPEHPDTLKSMNNLAVGYRDAGKLEMSLPLLEESVELKIAKLGSNHPETLRTMLNLSVCYRHLGQISNALDLAEQLVELMRSILGPDRLETKLAVAELGSNYVELGRFEEALPLLEEAYESSRNLPQLKWVCDYLAKAYVEGSRPNEFHTLASAMLESANSEMPEGSLEIADVLLNTASQYLKLSMFREAVDLLRNGTSILIHRAPESWDTFKSRSMLGGTLLDLAKLEDDDTEKSTLLTESESLLISGYEGMLRSETTVPPQATDRITEALNRIIELYTVLEKPVEVEKYRRIKEPSTVD